MLKNYETLHCKNFAEKQVQAYAFSLKRPTENNMFIQIQKLN